MANGEPCVCKSCELLIRADERRKIIASIRDVYNDESVHELGSFVWSEEVVDIVRQADGQEYGALSGRDALSDRFGDSP